MESSSHTLIHNTPTFADLPTITNTVMGDFTLPPLPPNFVPNFLTQPNPISNNDSFPDSVNRIPLLDVYDTTREDRFPKDDDGDPSFVQELVVALDNLAQHKPEWTLTREQWLEIAALYSQSLTAGTIKFSDGMGAVQLTEDLPLESRVHLDELSKNVEMLNRYFQLPYDAKTSQNYCHKCLTAEGTTPTDWQIQFERCGHNATAARESITNQYIQALRTTMDQWYESQRAVAHDHIILKLTNDNFTPEILTLDPCITEWVDCAVKASKTDMLFSIDNKAKEDAENQYQTALAQYAVLHENDLAFVRDDYERRLQDARQYYDKRLAEAESKFQAEYQTMIDQGKANRPIITDPTARKKRCGSVSTASSPVVTKSQPTNIPIPTKEKTTPSPYSVPAKTAAAPLPSPPAPPTDPMLTQIMNLMSEQFGLLTNRLDKLEAAKTDEQHTTSWNNIDYDYASQADNISTWIQPEIDKSLADQARVDLANIEYGNEDYVDPPNHPSYMGATPDMTNLPLTEVTGPLPFSQDSDCVLLSGPPTPTKTNPNPTSKPGLRPPERAQRVDFTSGKLASDSFGIPVGGVMKADGSISYNNTAIRPKNKATTSSSIPPHMKPYSFQELQDLPKLTIISHAQFAFNTTIGKGHRKEEVIRLYLNAATNATKPGARQATLSFAGATSKNAPPSRPSPPTQRQTTPSSWSRSPTPPPNRNRPQKPQSPNTTWIIRPRMGNLGLTLRPFNGDADKLTEYYRQRLQANAGESKPPLTLVHGSWAKGPKSIFSLTFAGHIPVQTVRAYSAVFLEKFDNEHIFHPGGSAIKKIALFNIPIRRDASGFPQRRHELFQELSRGGSPAGLALYDGPTWTANSAADPESTTGTIHIMVHDTTGSALGKFFAKPTYMYNKRIAMQVAIDPKPFVQCSRCHRLGHEVAICTRPANIQICYHCGSHNHASTQHKYACKAQHSGPTCDCRPSCFLCRIARKPPAQSIGHNALDSSCPLRRHTFVLSDPANTNPAPINA